MPNKNFENLEVIYNLKNLLLKSFIALDPGLLKDSDVRDTVALYLSIQVNEIWPRWPKFDSLEVNFMKNFSGFKYAYWPNIEALSLLRIIIESSTWACFKF